MSKIYKIKWFLGGLAFTSRISECKHGFIFARSIVIHIIKLHFLHWSTIHRQFKTTPLITTLVENINVNLRPNYQSIKKEKFLLKNYFQKYSKIIFDKQSLYI